MRAVRLIILLFVTVTLCNCGAYYKLLKSDDIEQKYDEAIRYYYNKDYNRAIALFGSVMSPYNGSMREDTVVFYLAKALYNTKDYEQAADFMNTFKIKFSRSAFVEEAEYIYAMSFYKQSQNYERDQSVSYQAINAFTEYLNRHPESIKKEDIYVMIDELNHKIYLKQFSNAALYTKLKKYNAAITALRSVLKQNPEIPYRKDILYLICKSWYDYAYNSVESRQLDRYLKMMDAYYSYQSEFPENDKYMTELTGLFEKAKKFSDEHGFQAQAIEKNKVNIEERLLRIAELKDKRFYTENKAERKKLDDEIKLERQAIVKDRETIKENKEELKRQQQQKKNLEKQKQSQSEENTTEAATPTVEQSSKNAKQTNKDGK